MVKGLGSRARLAGFWYQFNHVISSSVKATSVELNELIHAKSL